MGLVDGPARSPGPSHGGGASGVRLFLLGGTPVDVQGPSGLARAYTTQETPTVSIPPWTRVAGMGEGR